MMTQRLLLTCSLMLLWGCPGGGSGGAGDGALDGPAGDLVDVGEAEDLGPDGAEPPDAGVDGALPDAELPDGAVPDMGPPAVRAEFDPEMEPLPQPISGEETAALREGFDWAGTEAWVEENDEGQPALYYAIIYVASVDEYERLDRIGLHHWSLPLFEVEREQYEGRLGVIAPIGDGVGSFQFAIMSGGTYNAIRDYALEGTPPFQAVIPREPPEEFVGPDGSLSYAELFQAGFTLPGREGPREAVEKLTAFAAAVEAARFAKDAWNDSLGALENEFRQDKIPVGLRVVPMNTDPAFHPVGERTPMTRAWSSAGSTRFGSVLKIPGIEFVVGAGAGHLRTRADANGWARYNLGRNTRYHVCLRMDNHAVRISELWVSIQVCDFGSDRSRVFVNPPEERPYELEIQDWRLNIMAQMSDAFEWSREKLSHRPSRQVKVLVGALADVFGAFNDNRAFALCGGYGLTLQALEFASMVALVTAHFALVPLPPEWVALLQVSFADLTFTALSFDIIFPNVPADTAATSRGIATHEYGHFLTCDMLRAAGIFDTAWLAVVNLSITITQQPEVDILYVLEATADFITSQVAGGSNYYAPDGGLAAGAMSFCPVGAACWETNRGNRDPATATFADNLAATLTLIHDIFDGGDAEPRASWINDGFIQPSSGQPRQNAQDERIEMDLVELPRFFRRLGRRSLLYDRRGFVGIWAAMLRDAGYDENEICQLFALHSFMEDCREWLSEALQEGEVQPTTPILVSVDVVDSTNIELHWRDVSLLAESFRIDWGPVGEEAMTDAVPWARDGMFLAEDLLFDTRYGFDISTVNGLLSSRAIEVQAVTGAEPVGDLRLVEPVPGGAELAWDPTQASAYRVEYAQVHPCGNPQCDGGCDGATCLGEARSRSVVEPGVVLRDLEPGRTYVAVVIAENQLRVEAMASPELEFEAGDVAVLYVDPLGGDDGNVGDEGEPLATLATAVDRAARGADAIRFRGSHGFDEGLTLPEGVALDGGWDRVRGVWVRSDTRGSITVRGATRTRESCLAGGGDAAVVGVGDVALNNLVLNFTNGPAVPNICRVGVSVNDAELRLNNVRIAPAGAGGGCVIGAEALHGGVTVTDSEITGNSGGAPGGPVAGVCVSDGVEANITDSTITGSSAVARGPVNRLVGAQLDAQRVTITRSLIQAANPGVNITTGTVIGLDARPIQWLDMHNALVRTPAGGATNIAVDVTPSGPRLDLLRVGFSTLINGNATLAERGGGGHRGAVLRYPGEVQRVELINNALVLGSGREGTLSVLDRTRGRNPVEHVVRGNVASIRKDIAGGAVYVRCAGGGEFSTLATVVDFEFTSHICEPANGRGQGWQINNNNALDGSARRPAINVDADGDLSPFVGPVRTDRMGVGRGGNTIARVAYLEDLNRDPRVEGQPGVGAIAPLAMCVNRDWFPDADRDSYGGAARVQCGPIPDWSARGGDCADNDPGRNPSVNERCDRVDNDCDGRTDEGVANACGGCGAVPADVCDGRDNDCDGRVDELAGVDEGGRIDITLSTRESTTRNGRVNSPADIDHYRVHADESRSGNFGCEGGCATANEQTQFRADLTVPGDAGGSFQLCVGRGDGPNEPFQCVNIAPGQRRDLVVAMNGRNCCNGILCNQDNSAFFFATVRGQEACSNSTYRLVLTTFEQCVE